MNKIKFFREQNGITQTELAEIANLSLRTVQRVESGESIPKGHTLSALAQAMNMQSHELLGNGHVVDKEENHQLRLINISALVFIGIPFGNLFFPIALWLRYRKSEKVDQIGKHLINYHISWTVVVSILLAVSPFVQKVLGLPFPLILFVLLIAYCFNIFMIARFAIAINKGKYEQLAIGFKLL
ncbi:helix-turn-helix domain-containing protein [Marivirga sp. S37H4]|uniref:Helix-turn-helix domain-containing protein n=1 Tax=Marivirga aurantiaca TaxID=2802615 RepID=A0A934WWE9_9BACT|nr:helix-turn-helix domain-containing protein [Marivirga aurantiaca]MBK6264171.1 helix-turn-helix domain-containing protein [Marivirga aurantiaca]